MDGLMEHAHLVAAAICVLAAIGLALPGLIVRLGAQEDQ